ncbi:Retrovirus-related Pol polyprotein from transposon TNT 1-94 [Dendrobium catenatum]|uniref:Retrovirus-related Pol polyprotein from transposon TNT 1-94 n=1 Tax=Dendrobium catenatum TaxID=906689 RepID=A0A2I0WRZ9_9ASPA|nr:Retrovirus-related Pol polyprotein from transposon TNT 1-94 [Dendrobium catenatum]
MPTVRVFILVAIHHSWPIAQLDISNAFLHGQLTERVYMQQPPGFVDSAHPDYICSLKKAIYDLKQSPRQWYATLSTHLQQFGFKFSAADPSLMVYHSSSSSLYILIYVDDILLTGNDKVIMDKLLTSLKATFSMRYLGNLSQFLGIHVTALPSGIHLNQALYARSIVQKAGMENSKTVSTPSSLKSVISSDRLQQFSNPVLYRQLAGSLQYLTLTRPDIAFAVQQVCQHMHNPHQVHFEQLKRLLRYVNGTISYGLSLSRGSMELHCYADSDWAGDSTDRKSVSGYCNFIGNSLISWQVKKQSTVARSSTEAEYRSLAIAASEVIWLRRLLSDFNLPPQAPMPLYCDNTSAIALANNPVFHARTKHIEVDCHFIRDCIQTKQIIVHHLATQDQIADLFTKSLPIKRFKFLSSKLIAASASSV